MALILTKQPGGGDVAMSEAPTPCLARAVQVPDPLLACASSMDLLATQLVGGAAVLSARAMAGVCFARPCSALPAF